jgi:hypothetical protein
MRLGAALPIAAGVVDRILKMEDCIFVIGARHVRNHAGRPSMIGVAGISSACV